VLGLALQLAERAQLIATDRMRCWLAVLHTANVKCGSAIELDLRLFATRAVGILG
jgi:hypothetical protein